MANVLNQLKEKIANSFGMEERDSSTMRQNVQPRASKGFVIGKGREEEETSTGNRIFDSTEDIHVAREFVDLTKDNGNYIVSLVQRLDKEQLVVADFSELDERNKDVQFHALWGAVMALHGSFKILDKQGNLVLFTGGENKISEDKKASL